MLGAWAGIIFLYFVQLPVREARYLIPLAAPAALLCGLVLEILAQAGRRVFATRRLLHWAMASLPAAVLLAAQFGLSTTVAVPWVRGLEQAADFIRQVAPGEPVLYEGRRFGIFTYYLQRSDRDYRSRVVLGAKLLYVDNWWSKTHDFVHSPQEVLDVLRQQGGCRWLVVEATDAQPIAAIAHLREALRGAEFELVKTFPVSLNTVSGVSIYRMMGDIAPQSEIDMPLLVGDGIVHHKLTPIQAAKSGP